HERRPASYQPAGRPPPSKLAIGFVKLLSQKSRTRTARLIALGVIEKCHPSGTAEMLVLRIVSARDSRMVQGAVSKVCQTNFKFWELLMTNTRMFILFAALFIAQPVWYFWNEVT